LSKRTLDDLVEIMAKLRGNPGCPWDKSQTHETLKPFLVEEAYEVIDAIDRKSKEDLAEELGDLLLQIAFHSRLAQEREDFEIGDVIEGVETFLDQRYRSRTDLDVKLSGTPKVMMQLMNRYVQTQVSSLVSSSIAVGIIVALLMKF